MNIFYWIGNALLALIPGFLAQKRGRHFWGYYLLSFLLSPLFSAIVVLCLEDLRLADCDEQSADATREVANYDLANASKWQCSCGRFHPKYETSCICGKSKTDNLPPVSVETTRPESDPSSDKICFCRKCGSKLIENSKFCSKCGTEVVNTEKERAYDVYKM